MERFLTPQVTKCKDIKNLALFGYLFLKIYKLHVFLFCKISDKAKPERADTLYQTMQAPNPEATPTYPAPHANPRKPEMPPPLGQPNHQPAAQTLHLQTTKTSQTTRKYQKPRTSHSPPKQKHPLSTKKPWARLHFGPT